MKRSITNEVDDAIRHSNETLEALNKIKAPTANERKPDFTKIKDGDHFIYKGVEFIRLGKERRRKI